MFVCVCVCMCAKDEGLEGVYFEGITERIARSREGTARESNERIISLATAVLRLFSIC